ncbi:Hsp20/alpha crystallin family protein [Candidatus Fermentibacterales bacterium]|nr:Hsp20/alpha crystallin family protein [Candidatus Fermentibacterales bacterium]
MADLPARRRGYLTPFDVLRDEMGRWFDLAHPWAMEKADARGEWAPSVELSETEKEIQVKAELPGMAADDVEIEVADGMLTIRGEKREEIEEKDKRFHHREVVYGAFSRTIGLPCDVRAEEARASFDKGVLSVVLPKEEKALHRKIKISSSE